MKNFINYTCAKICPVVSDAKKDNLALVAWIDDLRAEIKQLADHAVDQQDTAEALVDDLLFSLSLVNDLTEELEQVKYRNMVLAGTISKVNNALFAKCNRGEM